MYFLTEVTIQVKEMMNGQQRKLREHIVHTGIQIRGSSDGLRVVNLVRRQAMDEG